MQKYGLVFYLHTVIFQADVIVLHMTILKESLPILRHRIDRAGLKRYESKNRIKYGGNDNVIDSILENPVTFHKSLSA